MGMLSGCMCVFSGCGSQVDYYDANSVEEADEVGRAAQLYGQFLLTWNSRPAAVDPEVNDLLGDVSLEKVVSSRTTPPYSDRVCSSCHYRDSMSSYSPSVDQYGEGSIGPDTLIGGVMWRGPSGWARRLVSRSDFDEEMWLYHLLPVFAQWLKDGTLSEPPVVWDEPISIQISEQLSGVRLVDVVSSRISGRADGLLCSSCHYEDGPFAYRPAGVTRGGSSPLYQPYTIIDGRTWAGNDGWADRFMKTTFPKPDEVIGVLWQWRQTIQGGRMIPKGANDS
ncbi:MAG: hypothetical protein KTR25_05430 [Myxococcales bacterium]|nr:hypothetical protein [Myxococcales bacterium]